MPTSDDAIRAGKEWLRVPERRGLAKLAEMWHLPARAHAETGGCGLCYFRPEDRGPDHKAKHTAWAMELAQLEAMWSLSSPTDTPQGGTTR